MRVCSARPGTRCYRRPATARPVPKARTRWGSYRSAAPQAGHAVKADAPRPGPPPHWGSRASTRVTASAGAPQRRPVARPTPLGRLGPPVGSGEWGHISRGSPRQCHRTLCDWPTALRHRLLGAAPCRRPNPDKRLYIKRSLIHESGTAFLCRTSDGFSPRTRSVKRSRFGPGLVTCLLARKGKDVADATQGIALLRGRCEDKARCDRWYRAGVAGECESQPPGVSPLHRPAQ